MLYFIVRVSVYVFALLLTIWLLPGVRIDMHELDSISTEQVQAELLSAQHTSDQEQLVLVVVGVARLVIPSVIILLLAFIFWFWNWLLWPVVPISPPAVLCCGRLGCS